MSYILDALKKSQANNQEDGMTVRVDPVQQPSGLSPVWAWVLGGLLSLNLIAVVWYFDQDDSPGVQTVVRETPAESSVNAPPPAQQRAQTPQQASVTEAVVEQRQPMVVPEPVVKARPRMKPIREVGLQDLPSDEQSRLVDFAYTSHIYTDDPEFCAVVINGQRLRTGDTFEELKIHAITEFGVVFESVREDEIWRIAVNPFQ